MCIFVYICVYTWVCRNHNPYPTLTLTLVFTPDPHLLEVVLHFHVSHHEFSHMRMGDYPELITYAYVWCKICERTPTRPHTHTPTHTYTDATAHTYTHINMQSLSHTHTHTHTHALRAYFAFRTGDDGARDLVGEREGERDGERVRVIVAARIRDMRVQRGCPDLGKILVKPIINTNIG